MLYRRQLTIFNPDQYRTPIHIIGLGGIGSWTALVLSKMGISPLHVYDDDTVEEHNAASQIYSISDIGILKREAIKKYIRFDNEVFTHPNEDEEKIEDGIIIVAVDSMEERHRLNELWQEKDLPLIDARMGGLQGEIYITSTKNWHETLVPPEQVEHDACTAQSICFNVFIIAGLIGNEVRKIIQDKTENNKIIFMLEPNQFLIH